MKPDANRTPEGPRNYRSWLIEWSKPNNLGRPWFYFRRRHVPRGFTLVLFGRWLDVGGND